MHCIAAGAPRQWEAGVFNNYPADHFNLLFFMGAMLIAGLSASNRITGICLRITVQGKQQQT
jgi:hypothetical protein